jgi:predicted acetyltransferase
MVDLVVPSIGHVSSYVDALKKGWSPNNLRPAAGREELATIEQDASAFLRSMDDPDASGPDIVLSDGSTVPRLPGVRRWLWDGEFSGSIGLRWRRGTAELPPYCLGHIGFAVVPWKRNKGYAKQALALLLPDARRVGLPYVELTTEPDNAASQKVILANGGKLIERFEKSAENGGGECLRFRIAL